MWKSMEEVWKSVWVSVEVALKWGKVCWDAERCGDVGESTHSSTSLSTLAQHSSSAPPHSPDTSLYTFPHSPPTFPLTLPHTPHTFPLPPPTLYHSHSPYFLTTPPTLPFATHALSFTPCQNFSLFSFIAKLV